MPCFRLCVKSFELVQLTHEANAADGKDEAASQAAVEQNPQAQQNPETRLPSLEEVHNMVHASIQRYFVCVFFGFI